MWIKYLPTERTPEVYLGYMPLEKIWKRHSPTGSL